MTDQPPSPSTWWLSSSSQKTTENREKAFSGGILAHGNGGAGKHH
jgi:hypothetical protein